MPIRLSKASHCSVLSNKAIMRSLRHVRLMWLVLADSRTRLNGGSWSSLERRKRGMHRL